MEKPYRLFCPACGVEQETHALRCSGCGGLLGVELLRVVAPSERHPFAGAPGIGAMWLANPVLPVVDADSIVSLGEGGTPCLPAAHIGRAEGIAVWLKNETANPTGSFKDRQVSVGISHALEVARSGGGDRDPGRGPGSTQPRALRFRSELALSLPKGQAAVPHGGRATGPEFYVVSSGNVAAAAAAYCARAGASCWVIAPASAPTGKLLQIQLCGAGVMRVRSGSARQLFELAEEAAGEFGWHSLSTAARANPFNVVGARTIAGEILSQMPAPDWVIAPVGGGGLLGSVWQGFKEAARVAAGVRRPRMAGVQAAGCAPFVQAVQQRRSAAEALANPWPNARTIAGGLADDIPFDAHLALPAISESEGLAVAVTDDEIREAQRLLARQEGLFIEPSGAVSAAGLLKLVRDGQVSRGKTACCLLTGSGLKDPASVGELPEPPVIGPDIEELRRVVNTAGG